jgi:hydroxypyruvate isomerase
VCPPELRFWRAVAASDRDNGERGIGCEYKLKTTTLAGLGWSTPYLAAR